MQVFDFNRNLPGIIAVIVIAAAIFMAAAALPDQSAAADPPAAAPTTVPQQESLNDAFQDFADRMALDRRLRTLEQQIRPLLNTTPATASQQPPTADSHQDFADRTTLDQRLRTLEQQFQTFLDSREHPIQTHAETFRKPWVRPKQTTTNYYWHRRHETDGTALAGEAVHVSPAARPGITSASGCPASVPCLERGTTRVTAPTETHEYDEAGTEIK
jgi:hypothetical protein